MNFVKFPSNYSLVVLRICEYLKVPDVKNLSLVSKEWFAATNTYITQRTRISVKYCYYWKFQRKYLNISVDIGDVDINSYLVDFLTWYKTVNADQKYLINELSLGTYKTISCETFKLLSELKSLKSLKLRTNYLEVFDESIDISFRLEEFGLYISSFYRNRDLRHADSYLKNICKNNRKLKSFHCDEFTDECLNFLIETCPGIESLNFYNYLSLYPNAINSLYGTGLDRDLVFFGIRDIELLQLKHLNLKNIRKLSLFVTLKHEDFDKLLENLPNITDLSLTVIQLEPWILSSLSKHLTRLTSLILTCGHGAIILEQFIFPKLENLEISNLTTTHLLMKMYTPAVSKITINDEVSREEFLNFLENDYQTLKELEIKSLLHVSDTEICCVLKTLKSLNTLKVKYCENFTEKCLQVICNSRIENAEITMFTNISLWKFKLFNRKWKIIEKKIQTNYELSLVCDQRKIVLNYIS